MALLVITHDLGVVANHSPREISLNINQDNNNEHNTNTKKKAKRQT
jgi:hypothetical protein